MLVVFFCLFVFFPLWLVVILFMDTNGAKVANVTCEILTVLNELTFQQCHYYKYTNYYF